MPAPRRSRQWWQAQVAALEASGQRHREFAAERGLDLGSLRHWLYASRRARRPTTVPALVEVEWLPSAPPPVITATVGRVELRAPVGVDPVWLSALLSRLACAVAPC